MNLKPCTASQAWPPPQALRRVSELAKPPQALQNTPDPTQPLKPCAQKWQTAAASAQAAHANATFRPRVAP